MITQSAESIGREDPSGSIFLPENQPSTLTNNLPVKFPIPIADHEGFLFVPNEELLKKYLSFQHPPENVLGMLYAQTSPDELPALLEVLDVSWQFMRGGYAHIDPEIDPIENSEKFDEEMAKRLHYREMLVEFQQTHARILQKAVGRVAIVTDAI